MSKKRYKLQARTERLAHNREFSKPHYVTTEWKTFAIFPDKEDAEKCLQEYCFPREKFRIIED